MEAASIGGTAVVAVGGYGRGELSPHSDIDLLFLPAPRTELTQATLRGLLYPLWDAGWQVGHAVRSAKDAIEHAKRDLDAATALLGARLVAGDEELFVDLIDRRQRWVRKEQRALARKILDGRAERHARADRAGWSLAPDIKEDVGGLRDIHTLTWLKHLTTDWRPTPEIDHCGETLLAVREALHAELKRKSDRIRIDLQPTVAARLGLEGEDGADLLMTSVHSAARAIEFQSEIKVALFANMLFGGPRRSGSSRELQGGVRLDDGILVARAPDAAGALWLLAAHSHFGAPIAPASIETAAAGLRTAPTPWSADMLEPWVELLRGPHCVSALEALDQLDPWDQLIPEWRGVRGRAQHDPYHRFTVDGHSFIAVGEIKKVMESDEIARGIGEELGDLAPVVIATLLHDIGKGSGEDHSVAGGRLARSVCERMGLDHSDTDDVVALVRHHLLLADTATRRDLDDGAVIGNVVEAIGTPRRLRMLYILTHADARATGPEAWSDWKAALVWELYRKALVALETGQLPARSDVAVKAGEIEAFEPTLAGRAADLLDTLPPSYLSSAPVPDMVDELRLLLTPPKLGEIRCRIDAGTEADSAIVTLCVPDRPGALARSAGVFALERIPVLSAQAYSTSTGLALERFVTAAVDQATWDRFKHDVRAAFAGKLAIEARLERKVRDYQPEVPIEPEVRILTDESSHSTVIEVRAPDALGLLFAITAGLNDLDLDIHVAKIDTLGPRVVDVFYVRTAWGQKLPEDQAAEVERAIAHRCRRMFGPPS